MSARPAVWIWQQPDRLWRWCWIQRDDEGHEMSSLLSYRAFESEEEAVDSARTAYPRVAITRSDAPRPGSHRRRRRKLPWIVAVLLAMVVFNVVRARVRRRLRGLLPNVEPYARQ